MEPPNLVWWCPSEKDGIELLECEIGGKEDPLDLTEDDYVLLLTLLRQRNALFMKMYELDPVQCVPSPRNDSKNLLHCSNGTVDQHAKQMTKQGITFGETTRNGTEPLNNVCEKPNNGACETRSPSTLTEEQAFTMLREGTSGKECYYGDIEELVTSLTQSNELLLNELGHLEEEQEDISNSSFEGIYDLRKTIAELILRNKKFEKDLTQDPLHKFLAHQLDSFLKATYTESEISDIVQNMENLPNRLQENGHRESDSACQTDNESCQKSNEDTQNETKSTADAENDSSNQISKEPDCMALEKELNDVKDELKIVTEEKLKLREDLDYLTDRYSKQDSIQRMHMEKIEQEKKQYYNIILEYQSGGHGRNREYDSIMMQVERERTEKLASINEQKALRQQLENLSKTMKSMQIKNEELMRFQCNQDDQADDFKRLKQLFQENGLPTIEQIIALQRQNEAYREDFLNERKEKERLLSIKDKLRRDLDSMQSRISSLQEQVYKYREHIFYLQQRASKDGSTSPVPPSPLLENAPPSPLCAPTPAPSFHNPSRLYGSSAPQYINESLMQGSVPPRFPLYAVSEPAKKGGPHGKHVESQVPGKPQWQYQQQTFSGKLGRHLSLDAPEWKRSGISQQSWAAPTENIFSSSSNGRHNSTNNYSSVRSGSSLSGSSEEGAEGLDSKQNQFGRKHGARNGDDLKQLQNFCGNAYEGWPRQNPTGSGSRGNQNFQRNTRRYSSPVGNGMRSPPDYWPQQIPASKPWQAPLEQIQFQDKATPGLRQCTDPWQQSLTTNIPKSSQVPTVTSSHGETYVNSGGFGNR